MTEFIFNLLNKLPDTVKADIGLYISLGLTVVVFVVALIAGMATNGDLGKFKACASGALKDLSPKNVNANMQLMPVKVKKQYKRAMLSGAKPSDVITVDAAINTPFSRSAISKLPAATAVGAVTALCIGAGISLVYTGSLTETQGIIAACTAVLGGLLVWIGSLVSSSVYKGALKKYDELMNALDDMRKSGAQSQAQSEIEQQSEQEEEQEETSVIHSKTDFDGPSRITVELDDNAQQLHTVEPEPQLIYSEPVYEQPHFEQPVYEQPQFERPEDPQPVYESEAEAVIIQEPVMSEAEQKAKAREEALAAARAEQAERLKAAQAAQSAQSVQNAQAAQARPAAQTQTSASASKTAAQQRLEELRAQREAQLKAQREAQAQARASAQAQKPSVSAEDVIARIEKINQEGATLPVMKEVALLLQQERAKPENKTPEQQKKLNEALSKLLKAMSAAGKK